MNETYSEVVARLATAQKGRARGAPAYSLYVNRKIGRYLAAGAHLAGLSPNQVTLVSAACTFGGIALVALAPPSLVIAIVIWLLLALGYAWDSADGQVARLRGGGSASGEWLDHFVDAVKVIAIHLAVAVGLFRFGGVDHAWLLVPLGFALVNGVTFFAMILNDLLKAARAVVPSAARGGSSPLRSLLLLPTDYGILCLAFVLWSWTPAFLVAYSAIFVASAVFLPLAATKWFREMQQLTPG